LHRGRVPDHPFSLAPRRAVVLALLFLGLQLAFGFLLGLFLGIWNAVAAVAGYPSANFGPLSIATGNTLAVAFLVRRELRRHGAPRGLLALRGEAFVRNFGPVLILSAGLVIGVSECDNLLRSVLPMPSAWTHTFFDTIGNLAVHPVSTPLLLVVIAPVTEELLFRGVILRGLLATMKPGRAILLSSALFMAIHLNPWQFPVAFFGGLIFGWIYLRTRSLALCLSSHALVNASAILAAGYPFTIPGFNLPPPADRVIFQPWWLDLFAVALLMLGVVLLHLRTPPTQPFAAPLGEPPLLDPA
jgi:membrane protease YdiL (CAAX protease family)